MNFGRTTALCKYQQRKRKFYLRPENPLRGEHDTEALGDHDHVYQHFN